MVVGKSKVKCDDCKKIIYNHIFKRFDKTLCADCYSIEFQKRLYSGKYLVFHKGADKE